MDPERDSSDSGVTRPQGLLQPGAFSEGARAEGARL